MAVAAKKSLSLIKGGRKIPHDDQLEDNFGPGGERLIQQIHFWCETHPNRRVGQDWCYNTYEAWAEQINRSVRQVKRIVKVMVESGVLITGRFNRMGYDRTLWYRIDYDKLALVLASVKLPKVTLGHEQTCPSVPNKQDVTASTIPEMITEMITESSSENSKDASIKAGETCKALEEQQEKKIGQEQKQEQKQEMQTVVKSGQITLFRKGKVSGSPVSFGDLALQVGTGEVSMATAKEILAKQSAVGAKAHKLPKLWQKEKARQKGKPGEPAFQNALTVVEMSQLKKFGKNVGDLAEPVMLYLNHAHNHLATPGDPGLKQ
jgi:hypothetical protein